MNTADLNLYLCTFTPYISAKKPSFSGITGLCCKRALDESFRCSSMTHNANQNIHFNSHFNTHCPVKEPYMNLCAEDL